MRGRSITGARSTEEAEARMARHLADEPIEGEAQQAALGGAQQRESRSAPQPGSGTGSAGGTDPSSAQHLAELEQLKADGVLDLDEFLRMDKEL